MLATMRATQIQPSNVSLVSAQRTAHSSQQTSGSSTINQQPNKVRNGMTNKPTAPRGKQDAPAAPVQSTPGLLTLSKPLQSYDTDSSTTTKESGEKGAKKKKKKPAAAAMQHQTSEERPASVRSQRSVKKMAALDSVKADNHLLSHSAPTSSADDGWEMPLRSTNDASATGSSGALTWQQQLLAAQPPPKAGPVEKKKARKKEKADRGKNAQEGSGLTWQQELLSSNKPRGQTYDVFADARDAATFGSATGHAASKHARAERQSRQRADSMGDIDYSRVKGKKNAGGVQLGSGSGQSFSSVAAPSTPNKLAYAGPNFHNSPSPASLPVPKFLQSKSGVGGGLSPSVSVGATATHGSSLSREAINAAARHSTSSASESEEDEDRSFSHMPADPSRFARGGTAPPTLSAGQQADASRSFTIENLLANMMRPSAS